MFVPCSGPPPPPGVIARARQQPRNANVLVEFRPVNALARADEFPSGTRLRRTEQQSREVLQGHADDSPVRKLHPYPVFVAPDLLGERFSYGNAHPMPSGSPPR